MRFYQNKLVTLVVSLTLALIVCASQQSSALPQSSNPISRGIGGLVGAASGAIAGGVAGANAAEGNSTISASAGASQSNGSGGASLSASANLSSGSSSGASSSSSSLSSSSSGSGSSGSSSGGLSVGGSASIETGSGGSSLSSQASVSVGSSTPKPEGLVEKVKEIFKAGKETIKSSVDSLTKDDKKDESKISAEGSFGGSGSQMSGGASLSLSSGSSSASGSGSGSGSSSSGSGGSLSASANIQSSGSQSSGSASASLSMGSSTPKPEGLLDKMSKMAEKGKEVIKDVIDPKRDSSSSSSNQQSTSMGGGISVGGSIGGSGGSNGSGGGLSVNANANLNIGNGDGTKKFSQRQEGEKKEGPIDKLQKIVNKGTDAVRDTVQKIEDKASSVGEKINKVMDENIKRPMQSTSGSGTQTSEGQISMRAQVNAQLKGSDRDRYLIEAKREQESRLSRPSSLKEVVTEAKAKGIIPQNEDRSALKGNHADEKSVTVEVFDKAHEISKIPVENVLRPIDKMLGYEKDPLMRIYDNSHELLRRPLSIVSKPVESFLTGAFKTSDEAKRDNEKFLSTTSEQERREAKIKEERARKEDRSVVGSIADKTLELATKPFEIVLKPFDHVLGFDKDGRKNPFLRAIDEIYGLSKKPVDAVAKPFESILKKMADGEQLYQVSIRFNEDTSDPKLFTRLADGALNVADRVLTKPLEIWMKPLNHALGYDEPGKKNPIMEAAHQLKNATKIGVELFTKPIDRIIKEIADIGANKSDAERDADFQRQKQEASRLVQALDKLHEAIQYPFEIVLRPMGKVLGTNKAGKKDPLLRAWDVIHQVVRTPIQVISKPVEEAILGDRARKSQRGGINAEANANGQAGAKASIGANIGPIKAGASISLKGNNNNNSNNNNLPPSNEPQRKNIITDSIKTVEKFASKPMEVITSPIRKMILGEDYEKVGSDTDKNNREIQARAQIGGSNAQASAQIKSGKRPDKIIKTLEKMNNVILKPLEEITQPLSDILSSEKKIEVKAQVSGQGKQQQQQPPPQPQQQQPKQFSASAQAQIKKN